MNRDTDLNDIERIVLSVLESAGSEGMYRGEILAHPDCESIDSAQDVSLALNKLSKKKGLIAKGERDGLRGFRWHVVADNKTDAQPDVDPAYPPAPDAYPAGNIDESLESELAALAAKIEVTELDIDMPETKIRTLRKLSDVTSGAIGSILNAVADDIERLTSNRSMT